MQQAPRHPFEVDRLDAIARLQLLADEDRAMFDHIARLAARMVNAPIAAVTLVGDHCQHYLACVGLDLKEDDRSTAFCAWTILGPEPLIVPDLTADPRFRENPRVVEGGLRFYAGIPILIDNGLAAGTLCVLDHTPRTLDADELLLLRELATSISRHLQTLDDQDELARTRRDLHQVNERLAMLAMVAAHTDNAVIITDAEGRIDWVNESFVTLTGYTTDEAIGRTPGSLLQGPETDPKTIELMRSAIRNGRGFRTEILNYTRSGEPYWLDLEAKPVTDASGTVRRFIAIQRDVTQRRRREESLATGNDRFLLLCEAMRDVVYDFDVTNDTVWWNDALRTRLGWDSRDAPKLAWWEEHVHPDDRDEVVSEFQSILESRAIHWSKEYRFLHADGSWRWVTDRARIVRDEEGTATRVVGTLSDVTVERESSRQQEDLLSMLRSTNSLAQVGGWEYDRESGLVTWSDEVFRIHELEPGPPRPVEDCISFYAPESLPIIAEAVRLGFEEGRSWDLELALITANGKCATR